MNVVTSDGLVLTVSKFYTFVHQCIRNHLSNYGLLAGTTDTFSHSLDSQSVQVGLQAPQHVVQFIGGLRWSGGRSLSLGLYLTDIVEI